MNMRPYNFFVSDEADQRIASLLATHPALKEMLSSDGGLDRAMEILLLTGADVFCGSELIDDEFTRTEFSEALICGGRHVQV